MQTTLLSYRWQNIFAIAVIVIGLGIAASIGGQVFQRFGPGSQQ